MIAYYLDPMASQPCDDLKEIKTSKREPTWVKVVCPRQLGSVECGYYVMRYMKKIIANPNQLTAKVVQKGIGHSFQYITTALAYSNLKMISDMKDTLKQFKILPKEF
ncbi:hypothetical protein AAG906_037460 [Vitis piasezkii]